MFNAVFQMHALGALALLAIAAPSATDEVAPPSLCLASETSVLSGQVEDDFGFDVAVCMAGEGEEQTLTIRWEGEGGGDAISCTTGECDGRIEYSRYTSPNLTMIKLAWRKDDSMQWLTQSLSRDDLAQPAKSETRHTWQPAGTALEDALDYPVITKAGTLALMELESLLENKPWHRPLFSEQAQ